jgi:putative heme-binding domain-containing protein
MSKHPPFVTIVCLGLVLTIAQSSMACLQDHSHDAKTGEVKAPKIFLDKNPRIVKYQLQRLDNERLLLVEREDNDKKYLLVHQEILVRDGMARGDRDIALQAIAKINESDPVAELLDLIAALDEKNKGERRVAKQLAVLLLDQKPETLQSHSDELTEAADSEHASLQLAGFSGLLMANESTRAFERAEKNNKAMATLLKSIPLLPKKKLRNSLSEKVLAALSDSTPNNVRMGAILALGSIDTDPARNFKTVGPLVSVPGLRRAAIKVLLKIPRKHRDESTATQLADFLIEHAEKTPPADRTSDEFIEAMQLADQVLGLIAEDKSDSYRKRLSEVTVRVVLIHTVEEEMRYDVRWFAVEAGRDVQVILKNEDLMAHNLVITQPDTLQEVALLAAAEGPNIGPSGKQYVPVSDKILFATEMVQAEKQARITFTAPSEPGEYPFVCTFPGHWMRMYGVMVVVNDLAEFQRNPVEPKDPVGSNRPIVQAWTIDDLNDKIETGLRGRTNEIGKKIFTEATCALCHKVAGEGKEVGPDLTDVWTRWKGDAGSVLREIIEPSHKIEPKYIVRKVITLDGDVVSGIVLSEDKNSISILPNPESLEPTVVAQDDIDDMIKSSVSIMPKGLMDRFTEDEIFELMAYLKSVAPAK